ncbi:MAG: hypothetical protein Q3976_05495 [Corynebacterium sp.]|nr:hypothetical protein [Corynebacterium sp.]
MNADAFEPTGAQSNEAYAKSEKEASKFIDLHGYYGLLGTVLGLYLLAMVLPYTGDVHGWEVVTRTTDAEIGIAETVFGLFSALAAVVGVGLILLTKRTVIANITYLFSGIALLVSVFSLWMRIQDSQKGGSGVGPGHFVEIAAIIVLVYTLSRLVFSRSAAQEEAAAERAAHFQLDSIGQAQQESSLSQGFDTADTNPLLIDDRRQRAARRHKPQQ